MTVDVMERFLPMLSSYIFFIFSTGGGVGAMQPLIASNHMGFTGLMKLRRWSHCISTGHPGINGESGAESNRVGFVR